MMTRRMFSTSILAGAAAVLLPSAVRSQSSVKARNVVLVHGAYADGSCHGKGCIGARKETA